MDKELRHMDYIVSGMCYCLVAFQIFEKAKVGRVIAGALMALLLVAFVWLIARLVLKGAKIKDFINGKSRGSVAIAFGILAVYDVVVQRYNIAILSGIIALLSIAGHFLDKIEKSINDENSVS